LKKRRIKAFPKEKLFMGITASARRKTAHQANNFLKARFLPDLFYNITNHLVEVILLEKVMFLLGNMVIC